MQRVRKKENAVTRITLGDEVGRHAASQRATGEKEPLWLQLAAHGVGHRAPGGDELGLFVRATSSLLRVEKIEPDSRDASRDESGLKGDDRRCVHIAAGTVGDDGRGFRALGLLDRDRDFSQR